MDEKLLQRPYNGHDFTKQEQGNLQGSGNLGGIAQIKDPKSGEQIPVFVSRDRYTHDWNTCGQTNGNAPIQSVT